MPPFYIGYVRLSRILKGYRGSVSSKKYKDIWNSELYNNPQLFKTKIISTHQTKEEAMEKENYFHRKLNVLGEMYINESISHKSFFVTNRTKEHTEAIIDSRKGYFHSEETKEKISKSKLGHDYPNRKGIPLTKKAKEKISLKLKGRKLSQETINKMAESKIGFKHSDQSKSKMRKPKSEEAKKNMNESYYSRNEGKIVINNGVVEKYVTENQLENFISDGWVKGRHGSHKPPSQKGKIWVNDGTKNAMVNRDNIPDGWYLGKVKNNFLF